MNSASSSTPGAQNRQKRVLPSRSRRGGPGVGTCEVDILILETLKRRSENEPLIPANTSFILTTNSKYASNDPGGAITVNMVANDRYFDRPEVVKAFREQAIIQTPEFSSIGESSNVGGRFRPRAAEDDGAETSDATYEKRHRKFETFEKRQRLREKEKLKHEHYKMKERLDQLRAMDSAAFMALPASSFSPMPKETVIDPEEIAAASSPYTNLNGYLPHTEGERRRKEMLDVATMLEERYRVLLPPDRVRRAPEPVLSESASRTQVQSRDGDDSETDQVSAFGEKLRLRLPARSSTSTTPALSPASTTPTIKKPRPSASSKHSSVIRILRKVVTTPSPPSPTLPHTEASPLSPSHSIDMNIPSSPEPEELEPTPPSPLYTTATAPPQSSISNEVYVVEPSSPAVPLSNGTAKASRTGSEQQQQNHIFPEQKRSFMPSEQDVPVTPLDQEWLATHSDREMPATALDQEMPATPPDQEISATPSAQEMLITSNGQEGSPAPSNQERPAISESEVPTLQDQGKPIHDQEVLPTPPEEERLSILEPERRPTSPEPESFITQDQGMVSSPPVPDRVPLEREKSIPLENRTSLTPLVQDGLVVSEQEKLLPLEERLITPERLPTPPERERTTTPEPQRLPTLPPVPGKSITPLVEVTDQDLQDSLLEIEPSIGKSIEPSLTGDEEPEKAETGDKMSVRAESEVPAPQNEPEIEEGEIIEPVSDKMEVEEDRTIAPVLPVAVIEQVAVADAAMDIISAILTEGTALPDIPQESAEPGPSVMKQADAPISEVGLNLDRPVTPEQRRRTESIDIEKMPSPMPISSISAPRGRGRKKARLDPSVQPNESASAPVRGLRIPKNHVTYIGASGEHEVTASAIMKAAVHRTQRDVTRHLNAFGVPVPNAIVQMGPPFELPEWVFPPLSPAESEHEYGDFDVNEKLELNSRNTPAERQVPPPALADLAAAIEAHQESMEVNPDPIVETDPQEPVTEPIIQPTRQSGPKNLIPRLPLPPPLESVVYEEDTVSLGDEDT